MLRENIRRLISSNRIIQNRRYDGEFRDREKIVRGIKVKDSVLINGYQMYHNYFRPHMGLNGMTPSEACGVKIEGNNKWLTLIQNASVK